jgi:dihydroxyacetone kinase
MNSADGVVDEALAGLVAAYPGLRVLRGHGVILREDAGQLAQQGKVWGAEVLSALGLGLQPRGPGLRVLSGAPGFRLGCTRVLSGASGLG